MESPEQWFERILDKRPMSVLAERTGIKEPHAKKLKGGTNQLRSDHVIAISRGMGCNPIDELLALGMLHQEDVIDVAERVRVEDIVDERELVARIHFATGAFMGREHLGRENSGGISA